MSSELGQCLVALERVAEAAERLGLDAGAARQTVESAHARLGFPGTAFVLALAGGTGAGKSSLLNALAGREVSRAGPIRPVTAEPVAWVPADAAGELGPLLRWVGVERVVSHHDPSFADLCLLDLPDYDSVERAHRARVDELLPRVDAVCWVLDPEKYNDRVLHEDYLRPLAHHAERAVFVVNRRDVIGGPAAVAELVADVRRTLAADGITGRPVFAVSAAPPDPDGTGNGDLDALRTWLSERMEAKSIVADRVAADCAAAGVEVARRAGLVGEGAHRPLVDERTREAARERAVAAARTAVDVAGVRRACRRRALAEAQASGAGPVGRALAAVARLRGGREAGAASARSIDPVAYARGWRGRASLSRTVNPVHELLRRAAAAAPPALRADVMALAKPDRLEERLGAAVDQAVARAGVEHAQPPRSWLWPLVGVAQTIAAMTFLAGVLWYATLYLAGRAQADLPDLPTFRDVPVPLLLLVGGLAGGWLLARLLHASARRQGRKWADRLGRDLDRAVTREVDQAMGDPLDTLEAARSELLVRLADLRQAARRATIAPPGPPTDRPARSQRR